MRKHTYTVALSDIRHPETGGVIVKRLGIVSPDTANHLRQVCAVYSIHGITVLTYPDAVCVVESILQQEFEQAQRAEARALVRTIYPVDDGEGEGDDVLARWLAPAPIAVEASTEEDLAEWLAEEDVRIAAERAERKAKDRADFKAMRALGGGMGSLIRKKAPAPAAVVAPVVDEFVDFDDLPF